MAEMTEKEADALDELWTKTTPKIKVGAGGGFFTEYKTMKLTTDIEDEIDAIRDKICEEINGMTIEEKTAYFTQKVEKQREKYNFCFVHSAEENNTKDFSHAPKTVH